MLLDDVRKALLEKLQQPSGRRSDMIDAVWKWWNAFKEWERVDTFLAAFREKRLCITQRPGEDNVTQTIKTRYDMEAKRSTEGGEKIKYEGVSYWVGVESLGPRMDPANFTLTDRSKGLRRKYALGLFDLSTSLLNPDYPSIKGQARWGEEKGSGPFLEDSRNRRSPHRFR